MVITLEPDLEASLKVLASKRGVALEVLAVSALRDWFRASVTPLHPRDEWERGLLHAARDWGVSLSNSAVSSEGLYD